MDQAVLDVLHSGYVGEGPKVKEFEAALALKFNYPNVLAVNSCTSALQLALRLANVGYGDTVLSTPATNMATNSVILLAGAVPYWVDVEPHTGRVDAAKLPKELPSRTKALIVMNWGGVPCDMDELLAYTKQHGIKLIVDAAHSLGATYKGLSLGGVPDLMCHSFQAVKTISTVDGGALVCREKTDHERGRLLRWFGIDRDNPTKQADLRCEAPIHEVGGKYHMHDVSATIGLANLGHYDELIGKTRDNAKFYDKAIAALGVGWVQGMYVPENRTSTYWLYTMRIHKERDRFAELLRKRGVACSKVHSRNDEHPCMPKPPALLVGVDEWYRTMLSIPCGWWVLPEDREYVMQSIRDVIGEMKS
jgi:dTDP-4-amino-4,6-dideoxygalactose transaminase